MTSKQIRTYERDSSIVFLRTHDHFGGLSNMSAGFPIEVNSLKIRTCEALYQMCRFPLRADIQALILAEPSPIIAKRRTKQYLDLTRQDWTKVRVQVMRWCLRVKLAQNWKSFSELLLETDNLPIVEESSKDSFWGAKPTQGNILVGVNTLGRLLMELREDLKVNQQLLTVIHPLKIDNFYLNNELIQPIFAKIDTLNYIITKTHDKASIDNLDLRDQLKLF